MDQGCEMRRFLVICWVIGCSQSTNPRDECVQNKRSVESEVNAQDMTKKLLERRKLYTVKIN